MPEQSTDPAIATDRRGKWMVVFSTNGTIGGAVINGSGGVTPVASPGTGEKPQVAAEPGGSWLCTWTNGSTRTIVRSSDGGQTWHPVATMDNTPAARLLATTDRLYVVYEDRSQPDTDIAMRVSTDGGATWAAPFFINDNAMADQSIWGSDDILPLAASDGNGTILAAWQTVEESMTAGGTSLRSSVFAAISNNNGRTWTQQQYTQRDNPYRESCPMALRGYNPHIGKFLMLDRWTQPLTPYAWVDPATLERSGSFALEEAVSEFAFADGGRLFALCYQDSQTWSAPMVYSPRFDDLVISDHGVLAQVYSAPDCTCPFACDNDIYHTRTVLPIPGVATDLGVTLAPSAGSVLPGQAFQYTLTVRNNSAVAARQPAVSCTLSDNLQLNGASATMGTLTNTGHDVAVAAEILNPGESIVVTIDVTAIQPGTASATAKADASTPDSNPADNTATADVTITPPPAPDLLVSKTASTAQANVSVAVTFTIRVENIGTMPATNAVMTDTLPAGLTYVSASSTVGTVNWNAGVLTANLGVLQPGQGADVTLQTVAATAGQVTNTATAATDSAESNTTNNTGSAGVIIGDNASMPDLTGTWQSVRVMNNPRRGTSIRGTLQVLNAGAVTAPATSAVFYLSSDAALDAGDTQIGTCSVRSIQPGRRVTVRLNSPLAADHGGHYVIAVLDPEGTVSESNEANNTCTRNL